MVSSSVEKRAMRTSSRISVAVSGCPQTAVWPDPVRVPEIAAVSPTRYVARSVLKAVVPSGSVVSSNTGFPAPSIRSMNPRSAPPSVTTKRCVAGTNTDGSVTVILNASADSSAVQFVSSISLSAFVTAIVMRESSSSVRRA